jgi:alpha-methylacyl-CoA racemase
MTSLNTGMAGGALQGVRVVEFAGLGPAPFACMLLSDMGAEVVSVQRPDAKLGEPSNIVGRGRRVLLADLKNLKERAELCQLIDRSDVLVEGFRPGVMERLELGPEVLCGRNPRLVYARMTGWGQYGPLARSAGHDLNYIALSGALHAIGTAERPVAPLNLIGDYGAGSLYLVNGILAALYERERSGLGQVIDAAITDGAFSLMSSYLAFQMRGQMKEERASNMLDGGAPYYDVYQTADGKWLSIAAIEPAFFALLCEQLDVASHLRDAQHDRARWPLLRAELARIFLGAPLDDWCKRLEGSDCCFAPVLPFSAARLHPHNMARQAFIEVDGIEHPAPAPRLSRTPFKVQGAAPLQASGLAQLLNMWPARDNKPQPG